MKIEKSKSVNLNDLPEKFIIESIENSVCLWLDHHRSDVLAAIECGVKEFLKITRKS